MGEKRRFLGGIGKGKSIEGAISAALVDFEKEILKHRGVLPVADKAILQVRGQVIHWPSLDCEVTLVSDIEVASDTEN